MQRESDRQTMKDARRSRLSAAPVTLLDYDRIALLQTAPMPDDDGLLGPDRVIGKTKRFTVVYGPFSNLPNPAAEIIFVGLTPGYQQLQLATRCAREHPDMGAAERAAALRRHAAFAGSMRRNLITMFDELGMPKHLGLASTGELFRTHLDRIAATSALRYPVFTSNWKNYGGGAEVTQEPLFVEMLERLLAPLLSAVPKALIVPFGDSACRGILYLSKQGLIDDRLVLRGFPHPSGANGHRKRIFTENKADLRRQLRSWIATHPLRSVAK